jgi:predicted neutral ceramidase superfamily lipid hydrolase
MALTGWQRGKLALRIIEIVFALISFAAAASLFNSWALRAPYVQFMVFTGVMAFIIAIFFSAVSCTEGLQPTFSGTLIEVIINAIWVVFWLAAAGSFADHAPCSPRDVQTTAFTRCNTFLASEAFAWLSWLLWIASLVVAVVEMRRGSGAKRYPGVV